MSIGCDEDIVLDTDASDGIICLEDIAMDKLGVCRVVEEVSLNEGSAEVAGEDLISINEDQKYIATLTFQAQP